MSDSSPHHRASGKPGRSRQGKGSAARVQIGSYRILGVIGQGGMGTVYKAVHTGLDRVVALKVLPTENARNPVLLERFMREARAAGELHHPNIVAIHDQGQWNGNFYLVLEYVEGEDLFELIRKRKRIPPRRSVEILKQAVEALAHAHVKGIIHRDIKPSNFLIRRDGVVKLADLGLAYRSDAARDAQVTRAGTTVGTVDYMAPEQGRDSKAADARSDIYSLGCTLYHMLTGQPPFPGGSLPEKLFRHAKKQPADVQALNAEVPDDLVAVLNRMMAKDPQQRYQDAPELLADLNKLTLRRAPAKRDQLASLAEAIEDAQEQVAPSRPEHRDEPPPASSGVPPIKRRRSTRRRRKGKDARSDHDQIAPAYDSRQELFDEPPAGSSEEVADVPAAAEPRRRRERPQRAARARRSKGSGGVLGGEQWMYVAGGAGILLLIGLIVYVAVNIGGLSDPGDVGGLKQRFPAPPPDANQQSDPGGDQVTSQAAGDIPELGIFGGNEHREPSGSQDDHAGNAVRVTGKGLSREEFLPPWDSASEPDVAARTVRLNRWPEAGDAQRVGSLQAAFDAIGQGETVVIEIAEEGPLFFGKVRARQGKKLILRAAAGYAPLLVYDPALVPQTDQVAETFGDVMIDAGDLQLEVEGLHFAAMADADSLNRRFSFLRSSGESISVHGCTFTVAGRRLGSLGTGTGRGRSNRAIVGAGEIIGPGKQDEEQEAGVVLGSSRFASPFTALQVSGSAVATIATTLPQSQDRAPRRNAAEPVAPSAHPPQGSARVRMENCYFRGAAIGALMLNRPSADVLVRNNLLVTGGGAAVQVGSWGPASDKDALTVRLIGCTIVAESTAVLLAKGTASGRAPPVRILAMDSLVATPRSGRPSEMLLADGWPTNPGEQGLRGVSWQSRNCAYLGWGMLAAVARPRRVLARSADQWQNLWAVAQPNVEFSADGWPSELAEVPEKLDAKALDASGRERSKPPSAGVPGVQSQPAEAPVAAAGGGAGQTQADQPAVKVVPGNAPPPGCSIAALPELPAQFAQRTFDPLGAPKPAEQPAVQDDDQQVLQIDLSDPKTDLGLELRKAKWAGTLTVELRGSGSRLTSPIRIAGKSLRLRFPAGRDEPISLSPRPGRKADALVEVVDGDLEIAGGRLGIRRLQSTGPKWLVRVVGGNLTLSNCRLDGPYAPTEHFDGAISWLRGNPPDGQGDAPPSPEAVCRLSNCILVGGGRLIHASISGRALVVEHCAMASSGDGIWLEQAAGAPHRGVVQLSRSTVWARGAFFSVAGELADQPADHLSLRLLASDCIFDTPLTRAGGDRIATLLRCSGSLIAQSRVAWQGIGNAYGDIQRFYWPEPPSAAAPTTQEAVAQNPGVPPEGGKADFTQEWFSLWGSWHEQRPLVDKLEWRNADVKPAELKPGDFALEPTSKASTWGPSGSAVGVNIGGLPRAVSNEERQRREGKQPVLNF